MTVDQNQDRALLAYIREASEHVVLSTRMLEAGPHERARLNGVFYRQGVKVKDALNALKITPAPGTY